MTEQTHLPGEVVRTGTVRVALPPDRALDLFTAEGEIGWAPGWKPRYVTPPDGQPVVGGVWLTGEPPEEVVWRVQRFDRAGRQAEYLRITPGNRVVVVQVGCAPDGGGTLATVTYRVVALSPAGRTWLDAFTPEAYEEMMREWERLIAAHLARASLKNPG
jgi:hypothetical protein